MIALEPPPPSTIKPAKEPFDPNAMHQWQLRVNAEYEKKKGFGYSSRRGIRG